MGIRKAPTREGTEAQPKHEAGNDDRDRLDVDAHHREEQTLPGYLVDQRGGT